MNATSILNAMELEPDIIIDRYGSPLNVSIYWLKTIFIIILIIFIIRLIYLIIKDKKICKKRVIKCIIYYFIIFIILFITLITNFILKDKIGWYDDFSNNLIIKSDFIMIIVTLVLAIIELIINRKKKEDVYRTN